MALTVDEESVREIKTKRSEVSFESITWPFY